jgi:D-alanyl-D-alanine carboxypeptidase
MLFAAPTPSSPSRPSKRPGRPSRRRGGAGAAAAALLAVALVASASVSPADAAGPAHPAAASAESRAAPRSIAWGGYANGRIPGSALQKASGGYLRPDAAAAYSAMAKAFTAKFGKGLTVTEGYRDFASQQKIFVARYTPDRNRPGAFWSGRYWTKKPNFSVAAVPGTSVHGWALAVDFGAGITVAGSAQKKWADANGPGFGWYPVGNTYGEPWHFEYTAPATKK